MFVINTAMPDPAAKIYVRTRLVVDRREDAENVFHALSGCGVDVDVEEVEAAPDRPMDEQKRARELMLLLYVPPMGNA
jgi:hypothetical protein